jgi:SAM-dependent methyltransferase
VSGDATFDADWLQRRERFDRPARAVAASNLDLCQILAPLRPPVGKPWRIIDLGCGTGASVRALSPLLPGPQQWLLVDRDAGLLAQAPSTHGSATCRTMCLDLASELHRLPFDGCTLLTASALLDLVGAAWLQSLVTACAAARVALVLALNVDGRWGWRPALRGDALARRLFAGHQRRDKGFGPALGPRAAAVAARVCGAAGYRVRSARSDWHLDALADPAAADMQRRLIDGITDAAIEQAPWHAAAVRDWRQRRVRAAARATLRVGHVDLVAAPFTR